jgi:hypothetical protein
MVAVAAAIGPEAQTMELLVQMEAPAVVAVMFFLPAVLLALEE